MTLIVVLLGAFFGAFFGYLFTLYLKEQELHAKRTELHATLCDELALISGKVQPYDTKKVAYRDPIRLIVPTRLLDGEALEYKSHSAQIRSLLQLQVSISVYNDFVELFNLVQSVRAMPETMHKQMYEIMAEHYGDVLTARDYAREHTPGCEPVAVTN